MKIERYYYAMSASQSFIRLKAVLEEAGSSSLWQS
jgi:hypothetical protein